MFRVLMFLLILTMISGCNQTTIKEKTIEGDKLGFSFNEMKSIINNPETKSIEVKGGGLKNKRVINLVSLGFPKEQIKYMSKKEIVYFTKKKSVDTGSIYIKRAKGNGNWELLKNNKIITKTNRHDKIQPCDFHRQIICTNSTIFQSEKQDLMELTISVSELTSKKDTYAVVFSFRWLTNPSERHTDLFGLSTNENTVADYQSTQGSYKSFENKYNIQTDHLKIPFQSSAIGYVYKFKLNEKNKNHFGYTYSEMVPADKTHQYMDISGIYIHLGQGWRNNLSFNPQDNSIENMNNVDIVNFKTPIIRIFF